jgi:hypothetical protein
MEDQRDHIGNDSAVEVDQGHVSEDLLVEARFRICGELKDKKVRFHFPSEPGLDQAVRELTGLDHFGLKRTPYLDSDDAGQPED